MGNKTSVAKDVQFPSPTLFIVLGIQSNPSRIQLTTLIGFAHTNHWNPTRLRIVSTMPSTMSNPPRHSRLGQQPHRIVLDIWVRTGAFWVPNGGLCWVS